MHVPLAGSTNQKDPPLCYNVCGAFASVFLIFCLLSSASTLNGQSHDERPLYMHGSKWGRKKVWWKVRTGDSQSNKKKNNIRQCEHQSKCKHWCRSKNIAATSHWRIKQFDFNLLQSWVMLLKPACVTLVWILVPLHSCFNIRIKFLLRPAHKRGKMEVINQWLQDLQLKEKRLLKWITKSMTK